MLLGSKFHPPDSKPDGLEGFWRKKSVVSHPPTAKVHYLPGPGSFKTLRIEFLGARTIYHGEMAEDFLEWGGVGPSQSS